MQSGDLAGLVALIRERRPLALHALMFDAEGIALSGDSTAL